MEENLIGKVAICSIGEIGIIQDYVDMPWGKSYIGIKMDGSSWASRKPYVIANSVQDYAKHKDTMNWSAIETDWYAFMATQNPDPNRRINRC
jgi:hypothetical protein